MRHPLGALENDPKKAYNVSYALVHNRGSALFSKKEKR